MPVRVDCGLAYEALLSLAIAGGTMPSKRYTHGPGLKRRYARLPDATKLSIASIDAGAGTGWGDLVGLVQGAGAPKGVAELVHHLESIRPLDLKLAMLGYHDRVYRDGVGDELFREAAAGGRRAVARFKARAPRARPGLEVGPLVDIAPEEAADRTIAVLEAIPSELYVVDRTASQVLSRAAAQAAGLARTLAPEAVVTKLTRGIVAGAMKDVLLVPTVIHGPWTAVGE